MLPLDHAAALRRVIGMTSLRLAIDLANYSAVPTASQVAMLKNLGVEKAIVGTSYPRPGSGDPYLATRQIAALETGGIPCEEYQFPGAYTAPVRVWWTDAETAAATDDALRDAANNGAAGVYTRRGWWLTNTQNWDIKGEFPNLRLWTAQYVHGANDPCLIQMSGGTAESIAQEFTMLGDFVPYAGFSAPSMVQWHDSVTVCGLNVDLNHIVEDTGMDDATKQRFNEEAALRMLAGAAEADNMKRIVEILAYVGVLPAGTAALKPNIVT